jgi:glycosyltransferase involved in cell wall biosynthesis
MTFIPPVADDAISTRGSHGKTAGFVESSVDPSLSVVVERSASAETISADWFRHVRTHHVRALAVPVGGSIRMQSMIHVPSRREHAESKPLVSIIVPTFNRALLLRAALASLLCQSWTNFEVVVVDDGSTDNTAAAVGEAAEKDKRIRYFRQRNGGVSSARNTGLLKARGDLIAFLDSDDLWHAWKLEAQVAVLAALKEVGMVWTDMDAIGPDGSPQHQNYLRVMYSAYERLPEAQLFAHSARLGELAAGVDSSRSAARVYWGNIYSQMLFGNLVHTSTVVLRRERAEEVGWFDESLRHGGEDYKYHLATSRLGDVAFLDASSIDYRVGADDQITNSNNQVHFARAFLSTFQNELREHRGDIELSEEVITGIAADAYGWLADALIESGARREAAHYAIRMLRVRPTAASAWRTLAKAALPPTAVRAIRTIKGTAAAPRERSSLT